MRTPAVTVRDLPAAVVSGAIERAGERPLLPYWRSKGVFAPADPWHFHCEPGLEAVLGSPDYADWRRVVEHVEVYGLGRVRQVYLNVYPLGADGMVHRDSTSPDDRTVCVYLHELWSRDWGGDLVLFEHGEIVQAVWPKPGRMVAFPGTIEHAARPIARAATVARMTLVIKFSADPC